MTPPKPASTVFHTPSWWLEKAVRVAVVGCGGTGSEVLDGLARLHFAMRALGHPGGLHVVAVDGDEVSDANVGRQRFGPSDVGHNKAIVLIHRLNLFYGLSWQAVPRFVTDSREMTDRTNFDLLLTCVDKASVRLSIGNQLGVAWRDALWMDFGNGSKRGQVILGHLRQSMGKGTLRLPNVVDLHPELKDVDDDAAPSCSLAEALTRQDLFVNRAVAGAGLQILWQLFRDGMISHHGAWINVQTLDTRPMPIDPVSWAMMGYEPSVKTTRRKRQVRLQSSACTA